MATAILLMFLACTAMMSKAQERCPPQESIAPSCICKDKGNGPILQCSNLMNADELIAPIRATNNLKMRSLVIINSTLLYVPSGVFEYAKFKEITFQGSQVMALSETDLAFEGLEDTLEELRATGSHYIAQWDWSQLKNLRKLNTLDINMISMYSLDHEFPPMKSLRTLGISQAELSFLHPSAFQELDSLHVLILKDNELKEFFRSMFPKNAGKMYYIDLSGNQIISLPDDIFDGMPSLKILVMNDNRMVTLNEKIFSWALQNLEMLTIRDNNIICDCRLRWMVQARFPVIFEGFCGQPKHLIGVSLKDLTDKNLWCY